MSRYRLSIETTTDADMVYQRIKYYSSSWFSGEYLIGLLRREIESVTKLDLPVITTCHEDLQCVTIYRNESQSCNVKKYDGKFYFNYRKPVKTCRNCISYQRLNRKCSWKDEFVMGKVTGCLGFLEKGTI